MPSPRTYAVTLDTARVNALANRQLTRLFLPTYTRFKHPRTLRPGDRLWVQETFCHGRIDEYDAEHPLDRYLYIDAPDSPDQIVYKQDAIASDVNLEEVCWVPSTRMPRRYSRFAMDVTAASLVLLDCIGDTLSNEAGYTGCRQQSAREQCLRSFRTQAPGTLVWALSVARCPHSIDRMT